MSAECSDPSWRPSMRILITGASGCVGQYLVEELLSNPEHELVLFLRDRRRLPLPDNALARVTFVECDLRDAARQTDRLNGIDAAVLLATAWGGEETFDVTVKANVALTDELIARNCRHILYFATASVLESDGTISETARTIGTDYIRAKSQLVEALETRKDRVHLSGLFPTLVMGGRIEAPKKPESHFAKLIKEIARWMWLGRFLTRRRPFSHYTCGRHRHHREAPV